MSQQEKQQLRGDMPAAAEQSASGGQKASGTTTTTTAMMEPGEDVPDRMQTVGPDRTPQEYEMEGVHRFEARLTDEQIHHGIGLAARRLASQELAAGTGAAGGGSVSIQRMGSHDLVDRPSAEEASKKALMKEGL